MKSRYDRPQLIHQAHVKVILDTPHIKDGSGKELRRLHDEVQQHLRALRSMGQEPSGTFVTSVLELILDQSTLFEWQRHSQASTNVPHYEELLRFLDLCAQASENSVTDKWQSKSETHGFKSSTQDRNVTSHTASTMKADCVCIACESGKHSL